MRNVEQIREELHEIAAAFRMNWKEKHILQMGNGGRE